MKKYGFSLGLFILFMWAPNAMATPEEDMAALAKRYEMEANAQRQLGSAQAAAEQSQAAMVAAKCDSYQSAIDQIDRIMRGGYTAQRGESLRERRRVIVKEMQQVCG